MIDAVAATVPAGSIGQPSAQAALQYLAQVMDTYHDRFPVYDDVSSGGNHFFAWSKIRLMIMALCDGSKWPSMLREGLRVQPSCGLPIRPSKY